MKAHRLILAAWLGLFACSPLPVNVPNVEQKADFVEVGSGDLFARVPSTGKQAIRNGDSVRTGVAGRGWVDLGCALVSVFGGSNLQVSEVRVNGANLGASGSQLFSSACGDIRIAVGATPGQPEAIVETTGTVFFVSSKGHMTLLWTQVGRATITNLHIDGSKGTPITVPQGMWSHVLDRGDPSQPQAVEQMGQIITEMGLGGEYSEAVDLTLKHGFGPGAPGPTKIDTIALLPATSTPTLAIPSSTPSLTPTSTPPPSLTSTPTSSLTPTRTPTPLRLKLSAPHGIDIYQASGNLWVTNDGTGSIMELDSRNPEQVLSTIDKVSNPNGIAIWQAKGLAYVTNMVDSTLTEIDLNNHRVMRIFQVGKTPTSVAVDEGTGDVYVTNFDSGGLTWLSQQKRSTINMSGILSPRRIEFSPARGGFWVASAAGSVNFIIRGDSAGSVEVPRGAFGLALSTDGQGGYLTFPQSKVVSTWGAKTGPYRFQMKGTPFNIVNLENCLGVVVSEERVMYVLDYQLNLLGSHRVGAQAIDLAAGEIAYNARTHIAYVTNYLDDSVTLIPNPCKP